MANGIATLGTRANSLLPISMRYGQYRYYWLALLIGVTGHQMLLQFTMGWLMFELTGEELDLTFLGLAIATPAIVFNVFGGALADRFEPRVLVTTAQSVSATGVSALAVMVLMGWVEPWHLLVVAGIIGSVQAFDSPSRSSIFPRLVQREHIVNAVAMESIVWNVVRILGPLFAGIIIDRVSIPASMFASAASFYLLGAVVSVLNLRQRAPSQGQVARQIAAGLRYVKEHSVFSIIMMLTFCNSMFGMAYIGLMPVFAKDVLEVGAERIGWLLGAAGIGAIAGTLIIGNMKDKHPLGLAMLAGAVFYGLGLVLFAFTTSQQMYVVSMCVLAFVGVAHSLYITGGIAAIQSLVPDQLRGRIMGLYGVTWSLGPLSLVFGGPVAKALDPPWAVAIGALIVVVVAILVWLFSPQMRSLPVRPDEAERERYRVAAEQATAVRG